MSKDLKHIDDFYTSRLEGFKSQVPASKEKKFFRKLSFMNFTKFGFSHFNIYYSIAIIALITLLLCCIDMYNSKNISIPVAKTTKEIRNNYAISAQNKTNKYNSILEIEKDQINKYQNKKILPEKNCKKIKKTIVIKDTIHLKKKIIVKDIHKKVIIKE